MAWFPFLIQNPFSPGTAPVPLTTGGIAVAFAPQPRSKTRFRQRYKTLSGHVTLHSCLEAKTYWRFQRNNKHQTYLENPSLSTD